MADIKVAKRYAKSFLGLVSEKGQLEDAFKDMSLIKRTTDENRDLAVMFRSPVVNTDKKIGVLEDIYGTQLSEPTLLFLKLITRKRRESIIPEIADSFLAQYRVLKGITTAVVTSATVLTDDAQQRIRDIVQKEVGGSVELEMQVNPDLIGGFVLRIGDKQLDTSIFSKVNELRQEFSKNYYEKEL